MKFTKKITITLVILLISASASFAASGDVDETFDAAIYSSLDGQVNVIKKGPDGKIYIGGAFTAVNGFARSGLARLNADGTIDPTFNPPDFFGVFGLGGAINDFDFQSDGKILVGGTNYGINWISASGLKRLNTDGSVDPLFTSVPLSVFTNMGQESYFAVKVLPDDKILVGGNFQFGGTTYKNLAKLNSDGTIDNSFADTEILNLNWVFDIKTQTDGKVLLGTRDSLLRINQDGSIDAGFAVGTSSSSVFSIEILANGNILIGGGFSTYNGTAVGKIARILPNGSLDTTFNQNSSGADNSVREIFIQADNKIVISGDFNNYNGIARTQFAQLNSDGSLDKTFENPNLQDAFGIYDFEYLSNGKILFGKDEIVTTTLQVLNADGSLDTSSKYYVGAGHNVNEIIQQPDGKILAAGDFRVVNNIERRSLVRLNADGSFDNTFNSNLPIPNQFFPRVLALGLQSDGKILVSFNGGPVGFQVIRLNPDGTLDNSFASFNLSILDIAIQNDGKILLAGFGIHRLNPNGTVDSTFTPAQPNESVRDIDVDSNGKIWIAGEFTQAGSFTRNRIAKLNSNGTVDQNFNPANGGASASVYDVEVQTDGKVVVGGDFESLNGNTDIQFAGRLNADGTLDASFDPMIDWKVRDVLIQPGGKVLLVGRHLKDAPIPIINKRTGILRLKANGAPDATFNIGSGANSPVFASALQSDGKILLGGEFTRINGKETVGIARLLDDSPELPVRTSFDFDGDGKSDVSVFRPSSKVWYRLLSSNNSVSEDVFAIENDILAPADYDGDGKTDLGIFRPSTASWWYLSSVDNIQKSVQFGANGDIPMPSDINGDGADDFVVFRPAENNWYRATSNNGTVSVVTFGANGDKPVIGDFDGDGKADPAIFRPSTGDWWYLSSIDGMQKATNWGLPTDIPVPADYDGDGKTDLAVYRPSEGGWYISRSGGGQPITMAFGFPTDIPVPADYDGDGKADIAVFRPETGIWYLLHSTNGFAGLQFGISTDKPIPGVFLQ